MRLDSVIYSSAGGREINEDSTGAADLADGKLFVLADGLGGHQYGQLASGCVTEAMLSAPKPAPGDDLPGWLQQQIRSANQKLLDLQKEKNAKMKSTIVALAIQEGGTSWAHVGDSRLYYFHQDAILGVTEDHSVAYRKYRVGEITKAQIGQDVDQPRLLRTLGNIDHWQPELGAGRSPEPGDAFLLCSDGVWEYLYEEELLIDLLKAGTAREWAELLLLRVMGRIRPGNDNLSLIAVLVH